MRRWTDGKSWSASRVSGSFLTYREMEGKRGSGFGASRRTTGRSPDGSRHSDDDQDLEPEGYRYKTDGLMKQSFSITTTTGQHLHLISYYARPLPGTPELMQPTADPSLRHITPAKGMYPESSFHDANSPALTRNPMQSYHSPLAHHQDHSPYSSQELGGYGPWGSPIWMAATREGPSPWPPSPGKTPPHLYTRPELERVQPAHMAYPAQYPPPPAPMNAPTNPPRYERLPQPTPWPAADRRMSVSPRSQQLQVQAAQAVMFDPRGPSNGRHQGPLPPLTPLNRQPTPPRNSSHSPPRLASFSSSQPRKASLSSILHTPTNSEPNSANPANGSSAGSSPRAHPAAAQEMSADAKAIRQLNRQFF